MNSERSVAASLEGADERILVDDLWARATDLARREAAAEGFLHWMRQLVPERLERGTLHVSCRGRAPAEYLRHRYGALLERLVSRSQGVALRVRVERDHSLGAVLHRLDLGAKSAALARTAKKGTASSDLASNPVDRAEPHSTEPHSTEPHSTEPASPGPASAASQSRAPAPTFLVRAPRRSPPPYRVVPETRLVHDALRRLAAGEELDTLSWTVVGPEGVGKSHLLDLFLHRRTRRCPLEKWERWSAPSLFSAYSAACRERRIGEFRGRLLANDGLVIEDVDQIGNKLQFQELLGQVFEYLRARRRPVLCSARRLPVGGKEFLASFRSQLVGGATLHVPTLPCASRAAILEERAASRSVPAWFLDEAANSPRPLARCLEAARQVRALGLELGRAPRRAEVAAALPDWYRTDVRPDPMESILERCAEYAGVPRESIVRGDRSRNAALGRHLVVYAALEICRVKRDTLKQWLGRLSPSVVPYAKRRVEELRESDPKLEPFLSRLAEEVLHGQRFLF